MAVNMDVDKLTAMLKVMHMENHLPINDAFAHDFYDFLIDFNESKGKEIKSNLDFDHALADLEKALKEKLNIASTIRLETSKPLEVVVAEQPGQEFNTVNAEAPCRDEIEKVVKRSGIFGRYKIDRRSEKLLHVYKKVVNEKIERRPGIFGRYKIDRRGEQLRQADQIQSIKDYEYKWYGGEAHKKYENTYHKSYGQRRNVEINFRNYQHTSNVFHHVCHYPPRRYYGNIKLDRRQSSEVQQPPEALADIDQHRRLNAIRSNRKAEISEKRHEMFCRKRELSKQLLPLP